MKIICVCLTIVLIGILTLIGFNHYVDRQIQKGEMYSLAPSAEIQKVDINIERDPWMGCCLFRIGMSENATLEYWDGDWWVFDSSDEELTLYQKLDSWLNKDFKYRITERFIDNR